MRRLGCGGVPAWRDRRAGGAPAWVGRERSPAEPAAEGERLRTPCGGRLAAWPGRAAWRSSRRASSWPASALRAAARLAGASARPALGARLGRRLDAGVERLHEVDDLGGGLGRLLDHDLVALALLLDERLDLLAVRVVVALGVPVRLHRLDEQLGHGELAVADLVDVGQLGQFVAGAADLVGEVHRVQGQRVGLGPDGHEVLLVAHDHGGDADAVRSPPWPCAAAA